MKSLVKAVVIAAILAAPVASFAQSAQQPLTRAEVRNQLIQLERAGYTPTENYPADIQAAIRREQSQNSGSGYGAQTGGSSQSGGRFGQPTLDEE